MYESLWEYCAFPIVLTTLFEDLCKKKKIKKRVFLFTQATEKKNIQATFMKNLKHNLTGKSQY